MHAKIVLLPGSPVGERLCGIAEEVLTDVSVAFGHTFSIVRDKIGEAAERAYGVPLSENTLRLCAQSNAVFLGDPNNDAEPFLLHALGIPAKTREFSVGGQENAKFMITRAVYQEKTALREIFHAALQQAKDEGSTVFYILPESETESRIFVEALNAEEEDAETVKAEELSPAEAIQRLLLSPSEIGNLVTPAYAGEMCLALATCLHGAPMLLHDACVGKKVSVVEPFVPDHTKASDDLNPLGAIAAVASLLRYSLHLSQEADCVSSAIRNVLDAGWRTQDMTSMGDGVSCYKMLQRISDQINLAGELLQQHTAK
ncbi:MAG: hypothetical protein IJH75_08975 [Mogibacterium sp.]|nr:hypothetical protein [Mogibacterium sp.]